MFLCRITCKSPPRTTTDLIDSFRSAPVQFNLYGTKGRPKKRRRLDKEEDDQKVTSLRAIPKDTRLKVKDDIRWQSVGRRITFVIYCQTIQKLANCLAALQGVTLAPTLIKLSEQFRRLVGKGWLPAADIKGYTHSMPREHNRSADYVPITGQLASWDPPNPKRRA